MLTIEMLNEEMCNLKEKSVIFALRNEGLDKFKNEKKLVAHFITISNDYIAADYKEMSEPKIGDLVQAIYTSPDIRNDKTFSKAAKALEEARAAKFFHQSVVIANKWGLLCEYNNKSLNPEIIAAERERFVSDGDIWKWYFINCETIYAFWGYASPQAYYRTCLASVEALEKNFEVGNNLSTFLKEKLLPIKKRKTPSKSFSTPAAAAPAAAAPPPKAKKSRPEPRASLQAKLEDMQKENERLRKENERLQKSLEEERQQAGILADNIHKMVAQSVVKHQLPAEPAPPPPGESKVAPEASTVEPSRAAAPDDDAVEPLRLAAAPDDDAVEPLRAATAPDDDAEVAILSCGPPSPSLLLAGLEHLQEGLPCRSPSYLTSAGLFTVGSPVFLPPEITDAPRAPTPGPGAASE